MKTHRETDGEGALLQNVETMISLSRCLYPKSRMFTQDILRPLKLNFDPFHRRVFMTLSTLCWTRSCAGENISMSAQMCVCSKFHFQPFTDVMQEVHCRAKGRLRRRLCV